MQPTTKKENYTDLVQKVRDIRNDVVKSLLVEETLRKYLAQKHKTENPSRIKIEFIVRALQNMLIRPVDLDHYSQLLLKLHQDPGHPMEPGLHDELVEADIFRTIKNHLL